MSNPDATGAQAAIASVRYTNLIFDSRLQTRSRFFRTRIPA